ncbi:MAG: GNAT family N-acetyltransferase [Chloroflexi bacterium]|jgi:ribosomal protein S18 acetylase RimI-like enzyme|nr:GNAT family N-acetyltransferase [Chloroflexota bacterium]
MSQMGKKVDIKLVGKADVNEILDVYLQSEDFLALGPQSNATVQMVEQDIEEIVREGGNFYGIFDQMRKMIGVVAYVPGNFRNDPAKAFLSLLMISKPYRSKGVGEEVVVMVEEEVSHDETVNMIESAVQVNNPRAISFWKRNGYRITSRPQLQSDGTVIYRLQKKIR